jgi:diguanylate cyclase
MPPTQSSDDILQDVKACLRASRLEAAETRALEALSRARDAGSSAMQARAAAQLAKVQQVRGDLPSAIATALTAIGLARDAGERSAQARAGEVVARVLLGVGDTEGALTEGLAALEAAQAGDDPHALAEALSALCVVYAELDAWSEATTFAERFRQIAARAGDLQFEAQAASLLAYVHGSRGHGALGRGDADGAREATLLAIHHGRNAVRLARRAGDRVRALQALGNVAEACNTLGRYGRALRLLDAAELDETTDPPAQVMQHLDARGSALAGLGRFSQALPLMQRCIAEAPDKIYELGTLTGLAEALERAQDLRGALAAHKQLAALTAELSSERARSSAAVASVRLETAQARAKAAALQEQTQTLEASNAQLQRRSEDLSQLANADALTGLPNRRRLDELLRAATRDFAIVMVDVDHFKRVNDTHSHLTGDAVLRELGRLLRTNCREGDTPVRFGGEEFALWLPGATPASAVAAAERTRALIAAHDWNAVAPGLAITASFGVAHAAETADTTELLATADARLYEAKRQGRNQVVGPG